MSVVVPVYEPGQPFDDLIDSLDRQTLADDRFEVILCDDGSGESTRARLDQIAHDRSNVRVITLPHTGWPGTPRNHGIEAARGAYVFFADQDDRICEHGLEAMCDYADLHGSDVVIGKVVGIGRKIPRLVFRRDVPHAELGRDPLLQLLTPHKLFRTGFLREKGIRFPDGKVRLEDHLFVMSAYFAASTISILASVPCYAWRKNPGSASSSRIDPVTYYPHLEAVLDLVEANTPPGPTRDALLRHWYRGKILNRIGGRRMVAYPDDYRDALLDAVTLIAQRRFDENVEHGLSFPLRLRSALLRAGRRDDLIRLARFEAGLGCRADLSVARWTRTGRLTMSVAVRVFDGEGESIAFTDAGTWKPPAMLGEAWLPESALDASRDLRRNRVDLVLRDDEGGERQLPTTTTRAAGTRFQLTADPFAAFGRRDPATRGTLIARVRVAGWELEAPLHGTADAVALPPSPLLAGRRIRLARTADGIVEYQRQWPSGAARDEVVHALRHVRRRVLAAIRSLRTSRRPPA